jgi:hypothetical protein
MNEESENRKWTVWERAVLALLVALVLWLVFLAAGCSTVAALKRPIVAQTNVVERVVTLPGVTNVVERVVTNTVAGQPMVVTNTVVHVQPPVVVTNTVTNVVFSVNPAVQGTIDTVRTVNSTLNPTPSAPFVEMGLLALSGVLGWVARLKTVKAARAAAEANAKNELLETVIAGVEAAKNEEVKGKIAEISKVWKTKDALDAKVQEMTR